MKIQMVDLKGQYEKIKYEIDKGIQDVITHANFIKGTQVGEFEESLAIKIGAKYVISCGNGTDALQVAMMALGLKPGDEVLIPVFTYVATAEVLALLGMIPVMIDVDSETFCIDPKLLEGKITDRTKAIVPVHLFGQCANMEEIMAIAKRHNLLVIEDTAQAIGAIYEFNDGTKKCAGTIGDIGTTSFFPSKNLGCFGDGGAIFTNNFELAVKIRKLCNHGQSIQYLHEIIGINSRLDTIQAAILLAKLPHINEYAETRNWVASLYDELLGNHSRIQIPQRSLKSTHVFHQYTILLKGESTIISRPQIRKLLSEKGIPSMIYYPKGLNEQKAFIPLCNNNDIFPVSDMLCNSVLSLPIHTEMTLEMIEYICENLLEILELNIS